MEVMEYVVGTIHPEGFRRLFRTERFAPSAADHERVKAQGREAIDKGFAVVDKALAGKNYLGGNELSIADAALFYVEYWGAKRLGMKLPTNLAAHYDRMMARPAVQRALRQEGLE
jgi:glutathione S-transferase